MGRFVLLRRRPLALALLLVSGSMVVDGCRRPAPPADRPSGTTTTTTAGAATPTATTPAGPDDAAVEVSTPDRARGGTARVGVWAAPDPASPGVGGAAVRALVLPQLFVARPDGRWSPSLVEPGTDRTAADRMSATFALRTGAVWSDGTPIGIEDLRRSMDSRFVAAVDPGPGGGEVVVRFTQPLPGWRRLWSAQDSISAPAAGVWGGPFVVASTIPGLETVLVRNDRWRGAARGPFLDGVTLVLVPDSTTARFLLGRGELDAVMPPAATVRKAQLERLPGVSVDTVERGGWSVSLVANVDRLALEKRRALLASFDRAGFVGTLLSGEATVLNGYAGPEDATWAGFGGDVAGLRGPPTDLAGFAEEPMTALVHRSMQKRARAAGGRLELRSAEADRVEGWVREGSFEAAIVMTLDPLTGCWRCRFGDLDGVAAADAGDPAAIATFEARLRDEARVLPLWRPTTVVAWRQSAVAGVRANGYAASAAWNAWEWFIPAAGSD